MRANLIKCKICGAEIAKNAKVCPQCGAKNKVLHPIRGAIAGLVALIFCIVFISALHSAIDSNPPDEPVPIEVSASDLWNAYNDNAVNADNLYKSQTLAVTGTISNIGQDAVAKTPCIFLETDSLGLYPIQCFFSDDSAENEAIAALKDGQSITITGICNGVSLVHVQLSDCHIKP